MYQEGKIYNQNEWGDKTDDDKIMKIQQGIDMQICEYSISCDDRRDYFTLIMVLQKFVRLKITGDKKSKVLGLCKASIVL